jgi:hypothetical protein
LKIGGWEIVRPQLGLFRSDEDFFKKIKIIFLKIGDPGRRGNTGGIAPDLRSRFGHLGGDRVQDVGFRVQGRGDRGQEAKIKLHLFVFNPQNPEP